MQRELVVARPSSHLRGHIERYCGYEWRAPRPGREREPLSTGVVAILNLGPQLGLVDRVDPAKTPSRWGSFVAGLDDACTVIEHDGLMRGIQVDLSPLAARRIFRAPMHSLARQVVALDDLLGREGLLLQERLMESSSWAERFALIERTLTRRLASVEPPPADIDWAWRRLVRANGRLRVTALAQELGCSRKHLAARFREHVGLPPKLFARMLRFQRACELMGRRGPLSLAEIATSCGYYDQAHLDRDFRDFAATTPTAYIAQQVTFIQDTVDDPS